MDWGRISGRLRGRYTEQVSNLSGKFEYRCSGVVGPNVKNLTDFLAGKRSEEPCRRIADI
jgi:hypothetical protein